MKTVKVAPNKNGSAIVSNLVKDQGNNPYFLKKAEEAKAILREVGIPGTKKLNFK